MVLAALLILTAVSIVVVTMSVANIRMSSRYNKWSKEYYTLDYATQERLIQFDSDVLVPAENMARYYLQNGYSMYARVGDFPGGAGVALQLKTQMDEPLQGLLYARMHEIAAMLIPASGMSIGDYDTAIADFNAQTLNVLYYYFIYKALPTNTSETPLLNPGTGISTACKLDAGSTGWFPPIAGTVKTISDAIMPPAIRIDAAESAAMSSLPKTVAAKVTIAAPEYGPVKQTSYQPLKINPLYTNAISAQGGITFEGSGTVNITGDVVSSNGAAVGGVRLTEGNQTGIKTDIGSSATVTIAGNVYSAGDVHLWGTGSTIAVQAYPGGYTHTLKGLLYENEYYYADSAVNGDDSYKESNVGAPLLPFIYKDSAGGNVYCNNLAIEGVEGFTKVTNGILSVAGDLWTQDDIQNDGGSGSRISVQGNYIGISSDANNGDPNGSSAVINNAVAAGGSVTINGDYVIPGTAFYRFAGGAGTAGSSAAYYQTAESGNARTMDTFALYFHTGSDTTTYFTSSAGDDSYDLYSPSSQDSKLSYFRNGFNSLTAKPASNIFVKDNGNYYSLGVVIDTNGTAGALRYNDSTYTQNRTSYYGANSAVMPGVFDTKTRLYGTPGQTFFDLTNSAFGVTDPGNGFYYLGATSGNTFVVDAQHSSGIVYSNGDLTLSGSGTFKGAIICAGNLTINSGVSIVHDESAIKSVLGVDDSKGIITSDSGSRLARAFFTPTAKPLTLGKDLATEQITKISTVAGEKVTAGIDRYTINSWKESHA